MPYLLGFLLALFFVAGFVHGETVRKVLDRIAASIR